MTTKTNGIKPSCPRRLRKLSSSFSSSSSWVALLSTIVLLSVSLRGTDAADSCPQCTIADSLLKPCNTSLQMDTWPGTLVYQPTQAQAPCACNQNYYDQMVGCLTCQSSSSAHYSVKDNPDYQLVCLSYGQTWKQINIPGQTTTTTVTTTSPTRAISGGGATPTTMDPSLVNGGDRNSSSATNSLSSGAIAGIVVSVIALIVALSVAGYVWGRRRRETVQDEGDLDEYKYRETRPDSYMEVALPQYTGMIQPSLPPISKVSNLRVMNPDSDDDEELGGLRRNHSQHQQHQQSFEVQRNSSPGWRRGSFDDD